MMSGVGFWDTQRKFWRGWGGGVGVILDILFVCSQLDDNPALFRCSRLSAAFDGLVRGSAGRESLELTKAWDGNGSSG